MLEEEEWLANLEAIIERDFFPDIPKLKVRRASLSFGSP